MISETWGCAVMWIPTRPVYTLEIYLTFIQAFWKARTETSDAKSSDLSDSLYGDAIYAVVVIIYATIHNSGEEERKYVLLYAS